MLFSCPRLKEKSDDFQTSKTRSKHINSKKRKKEKKIMEKKEGEKQTNKKQNKNANLITIQSMCIFFGITPFSKRQNNSQTTVKR